MNICFLDVDGVLNDWTTIEYTPNGFTGIDDGKVEVLANVIKEYDLNIVLSTDWREVYTRKDADGIYLKEKLEKYGLTVLDVTPIISHEERGKEILTWLQANKDEYDIKEYVIFDDKFFDFNKYPEIMTHLIHTNREYGGIYECAVTADAKFARNVALYIKQYQTQEIEEKRNSIYPLTIVADRYSGVYSGGNFLAFNMNAYGVGKLPIDAGDCACADFWRTEANDYVIGKGDTPDEAIFDLVNKLKGNEIERE